MLPTPKIIKSSKFEDGTFTIKAPIHPLPPSEQTEEGEQIDPVRLAAETESQMMLERAREAAEAALADAETQIALREQELVARLEAERLTVLAAAREEGMALGIADGQKSGQQAALDLQASALGRLHDSIEEATVERTRWFEAQQQDLIKLSLLIAQKILIMELVTSRESVARMAEEAIKHVTDKTQVRLRVHPGDLTRMNAARGQLLLSADNLSQLEIVGDPTVGLGGCMIDTRTGMVDARLSTQLAEIAAALLDLAPGPDGATDLDPMVLAAVRALGQGGHVLASAAKPTSGPQRPAPAPEGPVPSATTTGQAAALAAAFAPASPAVAPAAPAPSPAATAPTEEPRMAVQPTLQVEPVVPPTAMPVALEAIIPATEAAPAAQSPVASPPGPEVIASVPNAASPAPTRAGPREVDPSRRAADALSARLGKLRKGRGITTLTEEHDMSLLEGGLTDADLEAIVRKLSRSVPTTDIGSDQVLVHNPHSLEHAADDLAERLGKKRRHPAAERDRSEDSGYVGNPDDALADQRIDEIMGTLMPRAPMAEPAVAEPQAAPDLAKASESLAKLLGQPRKKSNKAWYDQ